MIYFKNASREGWAKHLVYRNYIYVRNSSRCKRTYYRCINRVSKRGCKASLSLSNNVLRICHSAHNHIAPENNYSRSSGKLVKLDNRPRGAEPRLKLVKPKIVIRNPSLKKQHWKTLLKNQRLKNGLSADKNLKSSAKKVTQNSTVKKPYRKTLSSQQLQKGPSANEVIQNSTVKKPYRKTLSSQQLHKGPSANEVSDFMYTNREGYDIVFRESMYKKYVYHMHNATTYYRCPHYNKGGCLAFVKIKDSMPGKLFISGTKHNHRKKSPTTDYSNFTKISVVVVELEAKLAKNYSRKNAKITKKVKEKQKPKEKKEPSSKFKSVHKEKKNNSVKIKKTVETYEGEQEKSSGKNETSSKGIIYFERSKRNSERLIFEDYIYNLVNTSKYDVKYWACVAARKFDCKARLKLSGNTLLATCVHHTHSPEDRDESEESLCKMVSIEYTGADAQWDGVTEDHSPNYSDGYKKDKGTDVVNKNYDLKDTLPKHEMIEKTNKKRKRDVFYGESSNDSSDSFKKLSRPSRNKNLVYDQLPQENDQKENKVVEKSADKKPVDFENGSVSSTDKESVHDFDETMERLMLEGISAKSNDGSQDGNFEEEASFTDNNMPQQDPLKLEQVENMPTENPLKTTDSKSGIQIVDYYTVNDNSSLKE